MKEKIEEIVHIPHKKITSVTQLPSPQPGKLVNIPIEWWHEWLTYWCRVVDPADVIPDSWPPIFVGKKANLNDQKSTSPHLHTHSNRPLRQEQVPRQRAEKTLPKLFD